MTIEERNTAPKTWAIHCSDCGWAPVETLHPKQALRIAYEHIEDHP